MKIENPAALRFIIDDDLYLLASDKISGQNTMLIAHQLSTPSVAEPEARYTATQPEAETPVINFKYKGGNKRQFLVLVHYANTEFIEDAHITALENILKRKDLGLDDVAIVNLAKHPGHDKNGLLSFFQPERLLIMGKEAIPAGFAVSALNQIAQVEKLKILYSFSFAEMMNSNENKKIFWDQMKNL